MSHGCSNAAHGRLRKQSSPKSSIARSNRSRLATADERRALSPGEQHTDVEIHVAPNSENRVPPVAKSRSMTGTRHCEVLRAFMNCCTNSSPSFSHHCHNV